MKHSAVLAMVGLVASLTNAVPFRYRRDLKYLTETAVVTEVDVVMQTVWVMPNGSPIKTTAAAVATSTPPSAPAAVSSEAAAAPRVSDAAFEGDTWITKTIFSTTTISRSSTLANVASPAPTPSAAPSLSVAAAAVSSIAPVPVAPATSAVPVPAANSVTSTSSSSSAGSLVAGATFTGEMTFYEVAQGSCGWTNTPDQDVVAIPVSQMQKGYSGNANNNPNCGKTVTISYGGRTKTAKVVDTCEGCAYGDLDMSSGLFAYFAPLTAGRLSGMTWTVD